MTGISGGGGKGKEASEFGGEGGFQDGTTGLGGVSRLTDAARRASVVGSSADGTLAIPSSTSAIRQGFYFNSFVTIGSVRSYLLK